MTQVYTTPKEKLYQVNNDPGSKLTHGRSWKNVEGHDILTKDIRQRHRKNQRHRQYNLSGTVYVCADLTEKQISRTWRKIAKALSAEGVSYWWRIEVTRRTNRPHWHVITASDHTAKQVKQIIRDACSYRCRLMFHAKTPGKWANYSLKLAKNTKNSHKVVLFAKDVSLRMTGQSKDFWHVNTKKKKRTPAENAKIREEKHKIREIKRDEIIYEAANELADALGLTDTPSIPEQDTYTHYAPQAEQTVIVNGIDYGQELREALSKPDKPGDYEYVSPARRDILDAIARNIMTDPSLYESYGGIGSFQFTQCPQPRKPPVRRKKTAKVPFAPFDPNNCDSFTLNA